MQKILIVEDEPEARTLLNRRLSAYRFEVVEASDGAEGIQKAQREKPDGIILDLKMPGDDGLQVYRSLREQASLQAVPVLFLTAISTGGVMSKESLALIASAKHGFELTGNFEVMGKPYDGQQLLEALRKMLETGRTEAVE